MPTAFTCYQVVSPYAPTTRTSPLIYLIWKILGLLERLEMTSDCWIIFVALLFHYCSVKVRFEFLLLIVQSWFWMIFLVDIYYLLWQVWQMFKMLWDWKRFFKVLFDAVTMLWLLIENEFGFMLRSSLIYFSLCDGAFFRSSFLIWFNIAHYFFSHSYRIVDFWSWCVCVCYRCWKTYCEMSNPTWFVFLDSLVIFLRCWFYWKA